MESKQYLISQNGHVHGFLVSDVFNNKTEAEDQLAKYKEADKENEYDEKLHTVEIKSIATDGTGEDGADTTVTVKVLALVDGNKEQAIFYVQTDNGTYDTQTGCWILTPNGDGDRDFDEVETLIYESAEVVSTAEAYFEE